MKKEIRKIQIIFDIENQNCAIFDNFYSTDRKTYRLFKGLVIGIMPKGRPGRMCNSAHSKTLLLRGYQ
mgnify:CR=1 FL=1